jgi:hypothetical protein
MTTLPNDAINNWSDIVPSIIKVPIYAYKYRHNIQKWWTKLVVAAGYGNTNVLIAGRPTVGKSVLSACLHGEAGNISWQLPPTSPDVEKKAIQLGEWTKVVTVIPGHTSEERDRAFHEAFSDHENLESVIYVANWGFTHVRDETITEKMIKEDGIETIEQLREYNLQKELRDFEQVCVRIREAHSCGRGPTWLAIAVNKADLFFKDLNAAQKYYHPLSTSPFTEIMNDMVNYVGKNNIHCLSTPICCYEEDLVWNGHVVKNDIGGTETKRVLLRYFIQEISRFSP